MVSGTRVTNNMIPSPPIELWQQILSYAAEDINVVNVGCSIRPGICAVMLTCRLFHGILHNVLYTLPLQLHIGSPRWQCHTSSLPRPLENNEAKAKVSNSLAAFRRRAWPGVRHRPMWSRFPRVEMNIHSELDYTHSIETLNRDTDEVVTLANEVSRAMQNEFRDHDNITTGIGIKIHDHCPWHVPETQVCIPNVMPIWSHKNMTQLLSSFYWIQLHNQIHAAPSALLSVILSPSLAQIIQNTVGGTPVINEAVARHRLLRLLKRAFLMPSSPVSSPC